MWQRLPSVANHHYYQWLGKKKNTTTTTTVTTTIILHIYHYCRCVKQCQPSEYLIICPFICSGNFFRVLFLSSSLLLLHKFHLLCCQRRKKKYQDRIVILVLHQPHHRFHYLLFLHTERYTTEKKNQMYTHSIEMTWRTPANFRPCR